jgi:predicted ferric reductase
MSGPWPWYVARASGLIAWLLLAAATLWGLAMATKVLGRRPRANWMLDMHRWLGGTALALTGIHVGALLIDQYINFSLAGVLVPFASSWNPLAVTFGVVSLYLLLAVELTSLARAWLPHDVWRKVHYASFPLFVTATVHGLTAGTDSRLFVSLVCMLALSGLVIFLTALRVMHVPPPGRAQPAPAPRPVLTPVPQRSDWVVEPLHHAPAATQPTRTDRISTTG